jgi:hypothetical protein
MRTRYLHAGSGRETVGGFAACSDSIHDSTAELNSSGGLEFGEEEVARIRDCRSRQFCNLRGMGATTVSRQDQTQDRLWGMAVRGRRQLKVAIQAETACPISSGESS